AVEAACRKNVLVGQKPRPKVIETVLVGQRSLSLLWPEALSLSHEPDSFLTEAYSVGTVRESGSCLISQLSQKAQLPKENPSRRCRKGRRPCAVLLRPVAGVP